eukprot:RCo013969
MIKISIWDVTYVLMLLETLWLGSMLLPWPPNILGYIFKFYNNLWKRNVAVQSLVIAFILVQILAMVQALWNVYGVYCEEWEAPPVTTPTAPSMESMERQMRHRIKMLEFQENAFLTGFGLFVTFAGFRILFETRDYNRVRNKLKQKSYE